MGKKVQVSLDTAKDSLIKNILGNIYFNTRYVVPMFEGAVGIGKSTFVRQAKQELEKMTGTEWGFLDIRLPSYEASDLQGIPFPTKSKTGEERLKWLKDSTFPSQHTKFINENIVPLDKVLQYKEFSKMYEDNTATTTVTSNTDAISFGESQTPQIEPSTLMKYNKMFYDALKHINDLIAGITPLTVLQIDIGRVNDLIPSMNEKINAFIGDCITSCEGTNLEDDLKVQVSKITDPNCSIKMIYSLKPITQDDVNQNTPNAQVSRFLLQISDIIDSTKKEVIQLSQQELQSASEEDVIVKDNESSTQINKQQVHSSSFDDRGEFSKDYDGTFPKYGIILLDEFNQVENRAVQSLTYQLILDHKINDMIFPNTWYFVCLGNREEDGGVYERIKAPVRNRLKIYDVKIKKEETLDYFTQIGIHPAVISFISGQPMENALHTYKPEAEEYDDEGENYVFATPRSWEFVSETIYLYEAIKNMNVKSDLQKRLASKDLLKVDILSLVGSNTGEAFMSYYKIIDNIDIDSIYKATWEQGEPIIKTSRGSKGLSDTVGSDGINYLIQLAIKSDNCEDFCKLYTYIAWVASRTKGVVGDFSLQILSNTCEQKGYMVAFDKFKIQTGSAKLFN